MSYEETSVTAEKATGGRLSGSGGESGVPDVPVPDRATGGRTGLRCSCGGAGAWHFHADHHEPAADQPAPRDAEVERLRAHVADLEARLAEVRRFGELTADSCQVVRAETGRDLLNLLDRQTATTREADRG